MNKKNNYKRIAIKIGSNVLTKDNGELNTKRIEHIVEQIVKLHKKGIEVILISSGAVAAGRGAFSFLHKTSEMAGRQVWSAIGQVKLMTNYFNLFSNYNIQAAQILATKENFQGRRYYSNMEACISAMLDNKIIPIINENDTITITELMFTDNDELSGWISSMMNCDALFVLTIVDGLFTGMPGTPGAKLIPTIEIDDSYVENYISPKTSEVGRGGMLTKYSISRKVAMLGIDVYVASGTRKNILLDILSNQDVPHTHFKAAMSEQKPMQKWMPLTTIFPKASIILTESSAKPLKAHKVRDIHVEDIENFEGYFDVGDLIKVFDNKAYQLGIGKAKYSSENISTKANNKHKIVIDGNLLLLYKY